MPKIAISKPVAPEPVSAPMPAPASTQKPLAKIFEKITTVSLYLLAALIPLWFLPITQDAVDFQKQALLLVLVAVALVSWLAKAVILKELWVRPSWTHAAAGALVLATILATITSLWRYGSFWGWPTNASDNVLVILLLALWYFLLTHTIATAKELTKFLLVFLISSALAGIFALLQLYHVFILPFAFSQSAIFTTAGSANSLVVLAAILLPIAFVFAFTLKSATRWYFWATTIALLLVVMLMNFSTAWIVLAAELLVMLAFGFWHTKMTASQASSRGVGFGWISFSIALLVVAMLFLTFHLALPGAPGLPLQVFPSTVFEVGMLKDVLSKNPFTGTGPGTFLYDYAKYHRTSLNQTVFWGTRFTSGASVALDWLLTKGIIGGLAWLALVMVALFFAARQLFLSKQNGAAWAVQLSLFVAFLGITLSELLYYSNVTLSFAFWLLLGALVIVTCEQQKKVSLATPSLLGIVFPSLLLLAIIFGAGLLFVSGQKYLAEVWYLQGSESATGGNTNGGIVKILSAAQLNPALDAYWRDLSQLYLSQLSQVTSDKNLTDEQKKQQGQIAISNAVTAANQAVAANPANVENWNVRGFVYRNLIGFQGADGLAIESYTKASALEPASPFSFTELGRVYLLQAQNLANQKAGQDQQDQALSKALENLNKAISLKSDYAPANYLIALVYGQQGKTDDEIQKLEKTKPLAPNDVGLAFQLGFLYYQNNQLSNAQGEFERALAIDPNYANAAYMLGLVYDKQGQSSKAVAQFTKVLQLNPDNAQVKQILANMNAGKPALTGISQSTPPIAENPPEISSKTKATK